MAARSSGVVRDELWGTGSSQNQKIQYGMECMCDFVVLYSRSITTVNTCERCNAPLLNVKYYWTRFCQRIRTH